MLKIDFGSGYNPKIGYCTCDITTSPFLDFVSHDNKIYNRKGEIKSNSVDTIHCRNVLHHIKDLDNLLNNFYKYLKQDGTLEIIDCSKDFFYKNVILDIFWYKWFDGGKRNIWFSKNYRNISDIVNNAGFHIIEHKYVDEKEIIICKK